jgi:hypothetical protein
LISREENLKNEKKLKVKSKRSKTLKATGMEIKMSKLQAQYLIISWALDSFLLYFMKAAVSLKLISIYNFYGCGNSWKR